MYIPPLKVHFTETLNCKSNPYEVSGLITHIIKCIGYGNLKLNCTWWERTNLILLLSLWAFWISEFWWKRRSKRISLSGFIKNLIWWSTSLWVWNNTVVSKSIPFPDCFILYRVVWGWSLSQQFWARGGGCPERMASPWPGSHIDTHSYCTDNFIVSNSTMVSKSFLFSFLGELIFS